MKTILLLLVALAVYPALHALAQNTPAAPTPPPAAQQCVACHGARGEGNPAGGFPRLAGQSQYYLAKQLESYASGTRRNPVMEPIAKGLSPQDRAASAAFFAQLNTPAAQNASAQPAQAPDRGRVLAMTGDDGRRIQACANCHGPGGVGEPPMYPYIAGLDAGYITAALNEWKSGNRKNDGGRQMESVAQAMSPEDITAVAQYFATLAPPKPAPQNIVQAPQPKQAAPTPSTSAAPAGPNPGKSVGVEQGSPTAGGTQGPGGSGAAVNRNSGNSGTR